MSDILSLKPLMLNSDLVENNKDIKFEKLDINQVSKVQNLDIEDIESTKFYIIYCDSEGKIQRQLVERTND